MSKIKRLSKISDEILQGKQKCKSKVKSFYTFNFLLVFLTFAFCLLPHKVHAEDRNIGSQVGVKVRVVGGVKKEGKGQVTIYGYTSPKSSVTLSGQQVNLKTGSNAQGYFSFSAITLGDKTQEICLLSEDQNKRITYPDCVSTPEQTGENISLGPFILPPTISLDKGSFIANETIGGRGQTIPGSEVDLSFFQSDKELTLVKPVMAYTLPKYTVKADQNGNFEFSLPSHGSSSYRVFANTRYEMALSPKSTTLLFKIAITSEYILEFIWKIVKDILPFLFFTFIFLLITLPGTKMWKLQKEAVKRVPGRIFYKKSYKRKR